MAVRRLVGNAGSADAQWQNRRLACCRDGTRADENGSVAMSVRAGCRAEGGALRGRCVTVQRSETRSAARDHFYNDTS